MNSALTKSTVLTSIPSSGSKYLEWFSQDFFFIVIALFVVAILVLVFLRTKNINDQIQKLKNSRPKNIRPTTTAYDATFKQGMME